MYDSSPDVSEGGGLAGILGRPATFWRIFRITPTDSATVVGSGGAKVFRVPAVGFRR
jgi:hypothetical protein